LQCQIKLLTFHKGKTMKSKTVYQTDEQGFFVYQTVIFELPLEPGKFSVPHRAYEDSPYPIPQGFCARRVNGAGGNWAKGEDHRKDTLYVAATGEQYEIGKAVDAGTYDGFGPLPPWLTATKPEPPPPTPEEILAAKKAERQAIVDAITVTTSTGKVFDGDEIAQGRMARAIQVAGIVEQTECTWVLADNVPTTVTLAELQEALALAMQAQADVWAAPYQ
jgi:hypothetical protein